MEALLMLKHIRILLCSLLISSLLIFSSAFAATVTLSHTGQSTCYDNAGTAIVCAGTGQDGDKQKGAVWPNPRFTNNGNGTATDNLTGLVWLKNANCFDAQIWTAALTSANTLASGACGLSDGSKAGQWRLPNITELESLVDTEHVGPALPSGHPFTAVGYYYWSSTGTIANQAWYVQMGTGEVGSNPWTSLSYITWPVRDRL
jgi:hypothetical protein